MQKKMCMINLETLAGLAFVLSVLIHFGVSWRVACVWATLPALIAAFWLGPAKGRYAEACVVCAWAMGMLVACTVGLLEVLFGLATAFFVGQASVQARSEGAVEHSVLLFIAALPIIGIVTSVMLLLPRRALEMDEHVSA